MSSSSKERLWTKDFLLDTGINFLVYLIYYLLMVIIAVIAKNDLNASLAEAGLASGIYIVGTLIARLLAGQQIELFGRKKMLYTGMALYLITTIFYFYIPNLMIMYIIRLANGFAYGVVSTATSTIIASCIPLSRKGEGINYYGLSTSVAAAVGPFIGMFMMTRTSFTAIIELCVGLIVLCVIGCFFLNIKELELSPDEKAKLRKISVNNFVESKVSVISFIGFWVAFCYASVLSFLAAYSQDIHLVEAGTFFFVVYAVVITISRPITGIIFDAKGENYVMYPCFVCLAIGLFLLSGTQTAWMLLLAGVFVGLGYGTFMSNGQAVCIKLTPNHRVGVAISTYFVALDLGLGVSPYILGVLRPMLGFEGLYMLTGVMSVICLVSHQFPRRKGLHHIVVDAGLKAEQLVVFFSTGRKHNDRNALLFPDLLAGGIAVQPGHHHVHDNDIIVVFPAECNRLHAVPCLGHLKVLKLCVFPHHGTDLLFVVYDQHFAHESHLPEMSRQYCIFTSCSGFSAMRR